MNAGNRESGIGNRKQPPSSGFSTCAERGPCRAHQDASNRSCRSHSLFPIPHSRQRAGRASRASGFTLLEVIAAIMLLAIAFAALMQVAGGSIRLSQNASEHSEAALWARSMLDTAFTTEPVRAGTTSGRFNQRFSWQLDVTPWAVPAAAPDAPMRLYQLDLDVTWGPLSHPRSAHFRTLRLASASPDNGNPQASR